ncbi:MAG: autotransporter domain-containing protein [Deltaproteobacteria bacterium]|nr:autotransporter domain-containing protein [Deltaproteobacteria bacterium]
MNTGKLFTKACMILFVSLFALAGVFSDGRSALAQSDGLPDWAQPCGSPPTGVDFDALAPSTTAQGAAADPGLLDDFALAARDQFGRTDVSTEASLYIGCLLRQEGSFWYSGATYVVTLTVDGRVFVHAKNMALSGGQLNQGIYLAILQALGIDLTVLTDPVTALAAFRAAASGNGGAFDVPGFPGASGYAAVYLSGNFRVPFVQLVGFDLDTPHLVDESIDYGDPATTAQDVVDRKTLKAFVTQAGEYVLRLQTSGNVADSSKARIALRDPNGPWRHGNVYLYVLDLTTNVILFHGANPDRYELRPLIPRQRDVVTGELILQQVLDAAKDSPEGGFVEYYLDDPTDDTDSADIPKVGYARQFSGQIPGSGRDVDFIIGSGFYQSSPNVVAARQSTAVKSVLPQVMRAMTASTVDAVSRRIQRVTADTEAAKGFTLGGTSKFSDVLLTNARALQNGTFDLGRLLAGSSFTLPLNAMGTGGLLGNLAFWGGGDYRNFSGGKPETMDYDGNVLSANLGVDTRLSDDLLAGLSLAWARGTVDYSASRAKGESETTVTSVNPYVGWQSPGGMNLWATVGYGWGEVAIDDSGGTQASDLTQRMVAAGVNGPLVSSDEVIGGGTTSLRLKGETAFSWADIDGSGTLESTTLSVSRQRLMLEGVHERKLDSGATFTPSIEVGMRYDGGDGDTGGSVETGGGLRFADTALGLTLEGRARMLFAHSGDYEEWGVSGLVRLDPGEAGLGFALSLRPAWGQTAGGVQRLWNTGVTGLAADDQTGRVHARIAYGFGTSWGGRGVLTPYSDVSLSGAGSRRLSLGGQFKMGSSVTMTLEGMHSNPVRGGANHGVMLSGHLSW